jgi:uncharacterized protein YjbI with pentapeptide repeats
MLVGTRQGRGSMLGRRSREFPSHHPEAPALSAKATDLDALRTAVVDAAGVGYGLWFSYLFALLYLAIAAGAVTHRDLLLENPVKLPFLNVELPLKAFFVLGPLVFLVVHIYVLLHFLLLAGKVGAFHVQLEQQIPKNDEKRAQLRRQLPSNIFVQFLAGPREIREGVVGFLLKSVALISLVAGPIALLILFQLQFLPFHNPWITWWQRIAVALDLILLWLLWPPIARGDTALLTWNDLGRVRVAVWLPASLLPLLLAFTVATFPGEWLEEALPPVQLIPTSLMAWQLESVAAIQQPGSGWISLHELLVAGEVDYVTRKPESLWSNRLILPNLEIGNQPKFEAEGKIVLSAEAVSLRGRQLEGAVFVGAQLRKADFTGAQLNRAIFNFADLREAKFECDLAGRDKKCAQLQGTSLNYAQLQGSSLNGSQLQGADLLGAQLQGASLRSAQAQLASFWGANLEGASLYRADLQVAFLGGAQLQGADLEDAQLQGAILAGAQLQGASLKHVFVWRTAPPKPLAPDLRTKLPTPGQLNGALIESPRLEPRYRRLDCTNTLAVLPLDFDDHGLLRVPEDIDGECDWSDGSYATLKSFLEAAAPSALVSMQQLEMIEPLGQKPYEEDAASARVWRELSAQTQQSAKAYPGELAKLLIRIGCVAQGSYVIDGLIQSLDWRLRDNPVQKAEVADAFLREENCQGARGLSEQNKIKLLQMRSPDLSLSNPDTSAR